MTLAERGAADDIGDADAIAIEHLLWAIEDGHGPELVLAAVGVRWPCRRPPTWHDVHLVLSLRWRRLTRQPAGGVHRRRPAVRRRDPRPSATATHGTRGARSHQASAQSGNPDKV
jgi:hypothetical protein